VTVSVSREGKEAVLEVGDTGPGIPQDKLDRVFQRFFRIDEARTGDSAEGGTGLGLAIVKAIVDLHGGTVSAGNLPSGGAVFKARLPLRPKMKDSS
jgi:two-component system sensor histidine kinase BaeS